MSRAARVLAPAILLAALSCAGADDVSGDRRVVGGVAVAFTARPARVDAGRPVRLVLRLTNLSGTSTKLTFPTSQQYDFWVVRGNDEVWRWSEDQVFTQGLETRTIDPQQAVTLSELWVPQRSGSYVVHGEVKAEGYGRDLTGRIKVGA